ncbi:MAG: 30S ribosomal protein S5, partial [Clostridiales bacterium]|nr:30S ribosomal protein S5 [Clostridiales bacterium]
NAVRATMEAIKQLKTVNSVAKLREKKVEEIR